MINPPTFTLIDPDKDGYVLHGVTTSGQPTQAFVTTRQLISIAARRGARHVQGR